MPDREDALYVRKSLESEDRQVLSIPAQVEELRALAARRDIGSLRTVQEARSAKEPGRPEFTKLLSDIQQGRVRRIFCWKLDRLARNPVDGGAIIWTLAKQQLDEIVTPGRVYTGTAEDKFMMAIEFGMATKYVDDLSQNVRRGMQERAARGWFCAKPPPGYRSDRTDLERRIVVKDPERFPLIRRAFDLVLAGTRPFEVLRLLNDVWGYRTPRRLRTGGGPLSRASFYNLLGNAFYAGLAMFKGQAYPGAHEPMLSPQEFGQVQKMLHREGRPRSQRHTWAFTGLLRCGECNGTVTASWQRNRHGKRYPYYHCKKRTVCSQGYVPLAMVEGELAAFLSRIRLPDHTLTVCLRELDRLASDRQGTSQAAHAAQDKARHLAEKKLDTLTDLRLKDMLTDEEYLARRQKLVLELEGLKVPVEAVDPVAPSRSVLFLLNQAENRFRSGDDATKRAIVEAIGSHPRLLDRKLLIEAQKPFAPVSKRSANPVWWT